MSRVAAALLVVLKRFTNDRQKVHTPCAREFLFCLSSADRTQIVTPVSAPMEINIGGNKRYLRAIVQHSGDSLEAAGQHYTAIVRHGSNWSLCDDSVIKSTATPTSSPHSYLFLYVQQ